MIKEVLKKMPKAKQGTIMLRLFGLTKIPLLWYLRPKVVFWDEEKVEVLFPLTRKSKNHLGSMYFAVLCAGADVAGGLEAMKRIEASGKKVSLAFKTFKAEFLKRPEKDVIFRCTEGPEIAKFVEEVLQSEERLHRPVKITALCPDQFGEEPVALFELELSLKKKS